jgi:hypothetical protein
MKPSILSDYVDEFVPRTSSLRKTEMFTSAHHFKHNEFLFEKEITAEDLLFPTQIFDLTKCQNT